MTESGTCSACNKCVDLSQVVTALNNTWTDHTTQIDRTSMYLLSSVICLSQAHIHGSEACSAVPQMGGTVYLRS